jgi:glycosyltransferase involved in cell wall biosynthesis
MRILYIVPGSGDSFYCQNCVRDAVLIRALRALGHDVIMVPMYLPLLAEGSDLSRGSPVFYGAVRLYIEEKFPALRRMPRLLSRLLDSPALLHWVASRASSTRARGLEDLTLSVLRGEHGRQTADLAQLVAWLRTEPRPDIVHLSNALLMGLAAPLKREFGSPVVCSLQDEDAWIDSMDAAGAVRIWETMSAQAESIDAFIAVSAFFRDVMARRMAVPPARIRVVPPGVRVEDFVRTSLPFTPRVIGYISRLAEGAGLGTLVDAFLILRQDKQLRQVRLLATGGMTRDDVAFVEAQRAKVSAAMADGHVRIGDSAFDRKGRAAFLQGITLLSVPASSEISTGTFLLEAMAAGVPVVQPRLGAYPEIVMQTQGGILYEPNTPERLAEALTSLLLDPPRVREISRAAREGVAAHYGAERTAGRLADLYAQVAAQPRRP